MPILGSIASNSAKAFGLTAVSAPKSVVTGGTLASDSTYYYRTFTANGTLSVSGVALACDYLVVAGGGAGGSSGGGGGGGLRSSSATLSVGSFNAVVGAGGTTFNNGNNSSFNSLASTGGGQGGGNGIDSSTGGAAVFNFSFSVGFNLIKQ